MNTQRHSTSPHDLDSHVRPADLIGLATVRVTRDRGARMWHYAGVLDERDVIADYGTHEAQRTWLDREEADVADVTPDKALARVTVWAATLELYEPDWGSHRMALREFWDQCDEQSADLEVVAARTLQLCKSGALKQALDGLYTDRALILDMVEVAAAWRGQGIGRQLAARTLDVAGAGRPGTLVLAIAGARTATRRAEITARAANLLAGLRLNRYPNGLWLGHSDHAAVHHAITRLGEGGS